MDSKPTLLPPQQPYRWQRLVQRLAALRPCSWALARLLPLLDRWALGRSAGARSLTTLLTGLPVIILHTTGAHSALPRRAYLVAIPRGEQIVLIASNFGSPHHPAWYHNLLAHPQVQVSLDGRTLSFNARPTGGPEREAIWRMAVASYAGFEAYRRRARGRQIPVVLLSPSARRGEGNANSLPLPAEEGNAQPIPLPAGERAG